MRRASLLSALLLTSAVAIAVYAHEYVHPKSMWRVENLHLDLDPAVRVSANVSKLTVQRQPVEVTWGGVADPSEEDMIAVYTFYRFLNPWRTLPVQFVSCAALDPEHLTSGSGKGVIKLLNLRNPYKFALVRGGVIHPKVAAWSTQINTTIAQHPTGGHLTLFEDQKSVLVQWISASFMGQEAQWGLADQGPTDLQTDSTLASEPRVAVLSVGRYRFTTTSTTKTYRANQTCGYPANSTGWIWPGYIHSALIPASTLIPGRRYVYHYGREGMWSEERSFIAPIGPGAAALQHLKPPSASRTVSDSQQQARHAPQHSQHAQQQGSTEEGSLVFLAFNDVAMNNPLLFNNPGRGLNFAYSYGENSTWLSECLGQGAESGAHLALMVGDLAYAMGYAADWDVFGDQFEAAFTQWPMAVGTGNHERDWPHTGDAFADTARDSGGECNVPFTYRWYTPANAKLDPFTSYYSFSQGPVHFLILDSETPSGPNTPQGRFVSSDLASVDRAVTPWVVAVMHRMMVAPATWRRQYIGDVDVMERLQKDYEDMFRQHQVDVVISGHEHAYARTCPIYRSQCVSPPLDPIGSPATVHDPSTHRRCTPAASTSAATVTPGSQQCHHQTATGAWRRGWQHASQAVRRVVTWLRQWLGLAAAMPDDAESVLSPNRQRHHAFRARQGGPVYILAGHAGAGFTHGFPETLPDWVEEARQDVNGYVRFTVNSSVLLMEAVVSKDGSVMDHVTLHL